MIPTVVELVEPVEVEHAEPEQHNTKRLCHRHFFGDIPRGRFCCIRTLLIMQKRLKEKKLRFRGAQEVVLNILKQTGFYDLFDTAR